MRKEGTRGSRPRRWDAAGMGARRKRGSQRSVCAVGGNGGGETGRRGEVGPGVTRLRAAAAAVGRAGGPGRPPGVPAACGISIPAARAAAVLARPQPQGKRGARSCDPSTGRTSRFSAALGREPTGRPESDPDAPTRWPRHAHNPGGRPRPGPGAGDLRGPRGGVSPSLRTPRPSAAALPSPSMALGVTLRETPAAPRAPQEPPVHARRPGRQVAPGCPPRGHQRPGVAGRRGMKGSLSSSDTAGRAPFSRLPLPQP
ncbi:hypothetical protein P7K49_018634 [Saguinus oedipus]|uniref:Uncharacterized protein n=1 Tax=Saguinus oedipus TaxID=9490 RepID=A0ABQ9V5X4_SAGOE|nr:hypothetical protein P7K49_018634 [Saguinus oedipus]